MNTLFLATNQAGGNNGFMIIVFVVLAVVMYFGMIRPQKKQQQKRMQMMDQLKKGDRVILVDGLHGKIDSINDEDKTVVIDADGIYLTFSRLAVRQVLPAEEATNQAEEKADDTKEAKAADANDQKPEDQDKQD